MSSHRLAEAASAANRFGLGARPGMIETMADPRGALRQDVNGSSANDRLFAGLSTSASYLAAEYQFRHDRKARKKELDQINAAANGDAEAKKKLGDGFLKVFGAQLLAEANARWSAALFAPIGFRERIVRFWSNHFAVSIDKRAALLYAAPMEREAIRPHLFGHFEDILLAVETHPAMLRYLDNFQSVGPDSMLGERVARSPNPEARKRQPGLNENLGREIMELHTLGVNGGYTQADVTELARAITGWSLRAPRENGLLGAWLGDADGDPRTGFVFRAKAHQPGSRTLLGKRYPEGGMAQGRAMLADLAVHPATARHLSFKLARHFVADDPPPKLLQRMTASWLDTRGDLRAWYASMLDSEEAWSPQARKFRTPDDFLIAALRALDAQQVPDVRKLGGLLARLGRPDFTPRSPAGFADTADAWIGPDGLWKRVQVAEELAARASRGLQPENVARAALGPRLQASTAQAVARADSPQQAVTLLLGSPDFQWRV